ncbi:hypothetical protein [Nocardioides piscis]|uniref:Uncharacterized protein n=1 Tax=Nocardioides piscis TaxID=2714938 RepID=A0A6G7YIM6_9ACTN|nr:hypothetical protein [Nocardioides piscis]QIK76586.1 hypothetical protein G7071_15325 [Nocardioides piscis]
MGAEKNISLNSQVSEHALFTTLVAVVQQAPYEIRGLSNELHQMKFVSGKTLMSWGHAFAATVTGEGAGSVLHLTVTVVPGAPKSLMDGRKNQKAAEKFIEAMNAALAAPNPPRPEPVESFATIRDGRPVPWTDGDYPGA